MSIILFLITLLVIGATLITLYDRYCDHKQAMFEKKKELASLKDIYYNNRTNEIEIFGSKDRIYLNTVFVNSLEDPDRVYLGQHSL